MSAQAINILHNALASEVQSRANYKQGDEHPYCLGYLLSFIEGIACRNPQFRDILAAEVAARIAYNEKEEQS